MKHEIMSSCNMNADLPDLYAILETNPGATQNDIKKCYQKQMLKVSSDSKLPILSTFDNIIGLLKLLKSLQYNIKTTTLFVSSFDFSIFKIGYVIIERHFDHCRFIKTGFCHYCLVMMNLLRYYKVVDK